MFPCLVEEATGFAFEDHLSLKFSITSLNEENAAGKNKARFVFRMQTVSG